MKIDKTILAILCITLLEAIALLKGIDGALFATIIAALSGLGGYEYHKSKSAEALYHIRIPKQKK